MSYATELKKQMNAAGIPVRMQRGLARYVIDGVKPGGFLRALLANDLVHAVGRADDENIRLLPNYVRFLYSEAPADCWGSELQLSTWKGLEDVNLEDE